MNRENFEYYDEAILRGCFFHRGSMVGSHSLSRLLQFLLRIENPFQAIDPCYSFSIPLRFFTVDEKKKKIINPSFKRVSKTKIFRKI